MIQRGQEVVESVLLRLVDSSAGQPRNWNIVDLSASVLETFDWGSWEC